MDPELKAAMLEDLVYQIQEEIEFLETTEGDTVECIGIENLEGILGKFFGVTKLNISIN
jgi:hypothetical protein